MRMTEWQELSNNCFGGRRVRRGGREEEEEKVEKAMWILSDFGQNLWLSIIVPQPKGGGFFFEGKRGGDTWEEIFQRLLTKTPAIPDRGQSIILINE